MSDPRKVQDLANKKLIEANLRAIERKVERRIQIRSQLESSGRYQGYNADEEMHTIKLLSGKTVKSESLTNAGNAKGDIVAVSGSKGRKRHKSMPRG